MLLLSTVYLTKDLERFSISVRYKKTFTSQCLGFNNDCVLAIYLSKVMLCLRKLRGYREEKRVRLGNPQSNKVQNILLYNILNEEKIWLAEVYIF